MQPTDNIVFVKEVQREKENASEFEAAKEYTAYQVTAVGKNVSSCKKGDFIWFNEGTSSIYNMDIISVNESEILGVEPCTEK